MFTSPPSHECCIRHPIHQGLHQFASPPSHQSYVEHRVHQFSRVHVTCTIFTPVLSGASALPKFSTPSLPCVLLVLCYLIMDQFWYLLQSFASFSFLNGAHLRRFPCSNGSAITFNFRMTTLNKLDHTRIKCDYTFGRIHSPCSTLHIVATHFPRATDQLRFSTFDIHWHNTRNSSSSANWQSWPQWCNRMICTSSLIVVQCNPSMTHAFLNGNTAAAAETFSKIEIFDSDGEFDQVSFMVLSIQKRKVKWRTRSNCCVTIRNEKKQAVW